MPCIIQIESGALFCRPCCIALILEMFLCRTNHAFNLDTPAEHPNHATFVMSGKEGLCGELPDSCHETQSIYRPLYWYVGNAARASIQRSWLSVGTVKRVFQTQHTDVTLDSNLFRALPPRVWSYSSVAMTGLIHVGKLLPPIKSGRIDLGVYSGFLGMMDPGLLISTSYRYVKVYGLHWS